MKRILLFFLLVTMSIAGFSQNTIKFLGIPIDGTKKEMISKLEAKGYKYDYSLEMLKGEFNGKDVCISVQTVNNRVWRIALMDANSTNDANIKVRFNNLFDQFLGNGKYTLEHGEKLTDEDNISYEMTVHKKRYEASFRLVDESINGLVWYVIEGQYGNYRLLLFYENLDNAANGDDL